MATLISTATGNFTAAGTWKVASAVTSAELDSEASSINLSTGNSDSATFVPAATQIDAVAIKISAITTPTGTVTVKLRNSTTSTDAATVTINASDLFAVDAKGWHVFSFAGVTPNGTDSFLIRLTRSVADGASDRITIFTSTAAASNMSREVRLVTTQAPAANDKLIVAGEFTGAGTSTNYTLTNDNTATTSFGPTVSGGPPQGMTVNNKSTFSCGTSASTNFYLKLKGVLQVYAGGTLNIGTSGTVIPSTSSAVLEFDSAANVDSGLNIGPGGTFNSFGATVTNVSALLAADAAAAATSLTTNISTGWANGDTIGLASTTRTPGDCESKALTAGASGTTLTITAITNAHSGTSPIQAELINLTRNVKVRGISASLQGYIVFQTTATVNCQYTEFTNLGSATASKRGIDVTTTTGSCSVTFCSIHDCTVVSSIGFNITGAASNNITFSSNVTFNVANIHFQTAATTGTWTANANVFMRCTDNFNLITLADIGGTFTNNTVIGCPQSGIVLSESAALGTFSGNTSHSNAGRGVLINAVCTSGTITTLTIWRNVLVGIEFGATVTNLILDSVVAFGNGFSNIGVTAGTASVNITLLSPVLNSDSSFATASGILVSSLGGVAANWIVENGQFGVVSGIKIAHTQDLSVGSSGHASITLRNCLLASSTEVTGQSSMGDGSYVRSQKHDQTAGLHKTFAKYGTISIDTVIFDTSPSIRLTPNNASNKLAMDGSSFDQRGAFFVPVANGGTATVNVKVRKSVAGDGTAYNGNQPRLIVRKNVAAGISADTVLATASGAAGSFETLTGTTAAVTDDAVLSLIVDCDGTLGWVNVDTWSQV